jgi:hypothetical protein
VVLELDDDWLGIDGTTDVDWFRFTLEESLLASIAVTPVGPSYVSANPEVGAFDGKRQSDLNFTLFAGDATTQLAVVDAFDIGFAESVIDFALDAGSFYLRVAGEADLNQFYRLDLGFAAPDLLVGDLVVDGLLDQQDVDRFIANWRRDTTLLTEAERLTAGDLDLNGTIDLTDWGLMRDAFNASGVALRGFQVIVPEPSAWALLAFTALFLGRRSACPRLR